MVQREESDAEIGGVFEKYRRYIKGKSRRRHMEQEGGRKNSY
jgi:hypothetical protein